MEEKSRAQELSVREISLIRELAQMMEGASWYGSNMSRAYRIL